MNACNGPDHKPIHPWGCPFTVLPQRCFRAGTNNHLSTWGKVHGLGGLDPQSDGEVPRITRRVLLGANCRYRARLSPDTDTGVSV